MVGTKLRDGCRKVLSGSTGMKVSGTSNSLEAFGHYVE
jgi:hypothetical protein